MSRVLIVTGILGLVVGCKGPDVGDGSKSSTTTDDDTTPDGIVRAGCDSPMPTAPVVPIYERIEADLDGNRVLFSVPEAPRGVVFPFHGTGGSVGEVDSVEWWRLFNLLHCEGIGVIIGEGTTTKWDVTDSVIDNRDMVRMVELRDHVVEQTELTTDLPVFAMGFSNGGHFASVFSTLAQRSGWDVRAMAIHNSQGHYVPDVPANYHQSENDTSADGDNIAAVQASHAATGLQSALYVFDELVIDPLYLTVLESHDAEQSAAAFDDLVAVGLIDAQGNRLVEINEIDKRLEQWADSTTINGALRVTSQLKVAWATHRMSGAYAQQDADLFADQLD